MIVLLFIIQAVILGILGSWVASQHHRSTFEGFILGFLFSVLGVVIEAILPPIDPVIPPDDRDIQ